jgi:molybdate transport system substrate-binding protein
MANPLQAGFFAVVLLSTAAAHADEINVAVAANFAAPMQKIAAEFEKDSGHRIVASFGSTGKFYAQIKAGAPFEVLLAADDETPASLEKEGDGVAGSRFTYAIGRLVLWSRTAGFVDLQGEVLRKATSSTSRCPTPGSRPTAQPASRRCRRLACSTDYSRNSSLPRTVGQTYQFVASGNAELGFVALSQVYKGGSHRRRVGLDRAAETVPADPPGCAAAHQGQGQAGSAALLKYLRGDKARSIISPSVTNGEDHRCHENQAR